MRLQEVSICNLDYKKWRSDKIKIWLTFLVVKTSQKINKMLFEVCKSLMVKCSNVILYRFAIKHAFISAHYNLTI